MVLAVRGGFQESVKLQRLDSAVVCSHSLRDKTTSLGQRIAWEPGFSISSPQF